MHAGAQATVGQAWAALFLIVLPLTLALLFLGMVLAFDFRGLGAKIVHQGLSRKEYFRKQPAARIYVPGVGFMFLIGGAGGALGFVAGVIATLMR